MNNEGKNGTDLGNTTLKEILNGRGGVGIVYKFLNIQKAAAGKKTKGKSIPCD